MRSQRHRGRSGGFTLIELLVVVAIIGILAAIAIPQFATYRARGFNARVEADARNAATGEEAYYVDNDAYTATCSLLPGYVSSQGVTCTGALQNCASGGDGFTITTKHAKAAYTKCVWNSCPASGQNLACS